MTNKSLTTHIQLPSELANSNIPEIKTEEVSLCPVCNFGDFRPYAYGYDYEIQTCRNEWRFVQCMNCDHVWLNPRPAISELPVIYPPSYYAYNYEDNINKLAVWGKNFLDNQKFNLILKYLKRTPKSYLDVGCGSGRFLRLMEKKGVDRKKIYGLELNDASLVNLKKDGFPVYCERVEDTNNIPEGSIDLITMFHVIEHVDDPREVINKLGKLLSDDGILAMETPNIDSIDAEKYKKTFWGGYHIPRHWNLFTLETMKKLMGSEFEVVKTQYQTGHSFWMYSNHHKIRYGESKLKKAEKYDPFTGSLIRLIGYTLKDKIRGMFGSKTSAMLVIAKKK